MLWHQPPVESRRRRRHSIATAITEHKFSPMIKSLEHSVQLGIEFRVQPSKMGCTPVLILENAKYDPLDYLLHPFRRDSTHRFPIR
jgi:hypothetical protein